MPAPATETARAGRRSPFRVPSISAMLSRMGATRGPRPLPGDPVDISFYHRRQTGGDAGVVSGRVWDDLDMEAVFARIDTCASAVGQQVLLAMLRRPVHDTAAVQQRAAIVQQFMQRPDLGDAVTRAVAHLRTMSSYDLPVLFLGEVPRRPPFFFVFPLITLAAVTSLVLAFFTPVALIALLAIAVANTWIAAVYRPGVDHLLRPIATLGALLFAARSIGALDNAARHDAAVDSAPLGGKPAALARHAADLRWIDPLARWLLPSSSPDGLTASLVAYVNLFLLLDVNAFVFSIALIRSHRAQLHAVYEDIGTLDALCAAARFRERLPYWCVPELDGAAKTIVAERVVHPLISAPQPNDLTISGNGMLITGSNMAGKTTFLRAVGLCALLGQSIATCPAAAWRSPPLRLATLISRRDDVLHGRSYFMVEAEVVHELLRLASGAAQHLFIIDEIFRGTNTRERVAASAAVLAFMNRRDHITIASTHDYELIDRLPQVSAVAADERWEFRHFSEAVTGGGASFDYLLRPGVSSAPNALRLLEAAGYPPDVVSDAMRTYEDLAGGTGGEFPGVDSNHH